MCVCLVSAVCVKSDQNRLHSLAQSLVHVRCFFSVYVSSLWCRYTHLHVVLVCFSYSLLFRVSVLSTMPLKGMYPSLCVWVYMCIHLIVIVPKVSLFGRRSEALFSFWKSYNFSHLSVYVYVCVCVPCVTVFNLSSTVQSVSANLKDYIITFQMLSLTSLCHTLHLHLIGHHSRPCLSVCECVSIILSHCTCMCPSTHVCKWF